MKTIVVTGASSGLGQEIALLLQKHRLYLLSRNKPCKELRRHSWLRCDISSKKDIETACKQLPAMIHIFIHCAGVGLKKPLENTTVAEIDQVMNTNLLGSLYLTQRIYTKMVANKSGHIIIVSSTSGKRPRDGETIYCASKFGQAGFAESLCLEGRKHHIKVTTVYPGGMKTNFYRNNPSKDMVTCMDPKDVAFHIISLIDEKNTSVITQMTIEKNS